MEINVLVDTSDNKILATHVLDGTPAEDPVYVLKADYDGSFKISKDIQASNVDTNAGTCDIVPKDYLVTSWLDMGGSPLPAGPYSADIPQLSANGSDQAKLHVQKKNGLSDADMTAAGDNDAVRAVPFKGVPVDITEADLSNGTAEIVVGPVSTPGFYNVLVGPNLHTGLKSKTVATIQFV